MKCNIKQSRVAAPEKRLNFTTKAGRKQKGQEERLGMEERAERKLSENLPQSGVGCTYA